MPSHMADVAVIVLTYNEELNIAQALDSVTGWAKEVFVLDSLSTDRTVDIARSYACHVTQHPFEDYAKQRNFALEHLPITCEWVFFLDADEWLPEALKQEISARLDDTTAVNGFYVNRRLIWMGRWVRHGYYPTWILRLFRRSQGRCENREVNEHLIVDGATARLQHDLIHEDRKGVTAWIAKHNDYATRSARALLATTPGTGDREIAAKFFGAQAERTRWLRQRVWNRLPPLIRPFLYFSYRYIVKGGFLDGRPGFIFHFMQALWFPLLIDVKYLELTWARPVSKGTDAADR